MHDQKSQKTTTIAFQTFSRTLGFLFSNLFSTLSLEMPLNIDIPHLLKRLQLLLTVSEFTSLNMYLISFITYPLANFSDSSSLFIQAHFCYINTPTFAHVLSIWIILSSGPLGNYSVQVPCHVPHLPP